jgi:hypothetical protein
MEQVLQRRNAMTPIGLTIRLGALSCASRRFFQHFRRFDGKYAVEFGCTGVFISFVVGKPNDTHSR